MIDMLLDMSDTAYVWFIFACIVLLVLSPFILAGIIALCATATERIGDKIISWRQLYIQCIGRRNLSANPILEIQRNGSGDVRYLVRWHAPKFGSAILYSANGKILPQHSTLKIARYENVADARAKADAIIDMRVHDYNAHMARQWETMMREECFKVCEE